MSPFFYSLLIQNALFFGFLGIETLVTQSHSWKTALRMGGVSLLLLIAVNLLFYFVKPFLQFEQVDFFLLPIFFVMVVLVCLSFQLLVKLFFASWALEEKAFWQKLPFHSLLLGSLFFIQAEELSLNLVLMKSLSMGLGWLLFLWFFTACRKRLSGSGLMTTAQLLGLLFLLLGVASLLSQAFYGIFFTSS